MKDTDPRIIYTLNHLIEVCKDGEKGFREAAVDVRDPKYRETFLHYAHRMGIFGASLQDEVVRMGFVPREQGTLLGLLHRFGIYARTLLNRHDPRVALLECERGEHKALDAFQQAVEEPGIGNAKILIEEPFVELIEMSNKMKELESGNSKFEDPGSLLRLQ